jgi:hypothetical protein
MFLQPKFDTFKCALTKSGSFLVKSMYLVYMDDHKSFLESIFGRWKFRLNQIFMWFLHEKVLFTKDNLAKRKWQGCNNCYFCDQKEMIQHLFISCPLAQMVWQIVHMAFNIIPHNTPHPPPPHPNITNLLRNW